MNHFKFLLVDDDNLFLDIASGLIELAFPGSTVDRLSNAEAVVRAVHAEEYDCLLIDYEMPRSDGITVARAVRHDLPSLPIVLITGAGDEEIAIRALHGGITDYLPKARMSAESMRRTLKRAIELCQQRRVIDEQRKELEMFAHALAHDFKQPLRQMATFTKLVADELGRSESPKVRKHLRFIGDAARRLTALVDVMSAYTLLNRAPTMASGRVRTVVSDAVSALAEYIAERNAVVANRADGVFFGNATMMTYVVQNLITNGLKFNRNSKPRIEIDSVSDGVRCEITISDNGIGIAEDQREAIFAPLMRLHRQDEFSGTGLGLTLARRALVRQLGDIRCHANPGGGSRFVITIPLRDAIRRSPEPDDDRAHLLVV